MDARTVVDQMPRSSLVRDGAAKSGTRLEPRRADDPAVVVADEPVRSVASGRHDAAPRLSPDPMRATDRYRLVMPWSARF